MLPVHTNTHNTYTEEKTTMHIYKRFNGNHLIKKIYDTETPPHITTCKNQDRYQGVIYELK